LSEIVVHDDKQVGRKLKRHANVHISPNSADESCKFRPEQIVLSATPIPIRRKCVKVNISDGAGGASKKKAHQDASLPRRLSTAQVLDFSAAYCSTNQTIDELS
jgi:hypothetical protein